MNRLKILVSSAVLIFTSIFGASLAYCQITPSADAYTNSAAPSTNYGAGVLLDVDGATQASYIQFNLASIPSTYTGADITKATLKLYVNSVTMAGSFNVDYVNGTWAENTITHSLAPALGTTIAASVPITTVEKNQFVLIDVTAAVQAWLSGTPNDGIALVANGTFNATFDSKESTSTSHAPELDVVFAGGGLSGVTTASGSGLTGGGTSGTLNLGLLTTCARGQVLEWNGSAWACATTSGTGTVTRVGSGTGLTGGPITGTGTLSIDTTKVPLLASANTFTANQTVNATITANSSGNSIVGYSSASGYGVEGMSPAGIGVFGQSLSTSGTAGYGVAGESNATLGAGAYGSNTATTGLAMGVLGATASTAGYGVVGLQGGPTIVAGNPAGVYGATAAAVGFGVQGSSPNWVGVYGTGVTGVAGETNSPSGYAVSGITYSTGTTAGVFGETGSPAGYGVEGQSDSSSGTTAGVYGTTQSTAGYGVEGNSPYAGVIGNSSTSSGYGVGGNSPFVGVFGGQAGQQFATSGVSYGVVGASPNVGIYGASSGISNTGTVPPYPSGAWGDTGGPPGEYVGVLATADENPALVAANNDGTGFYPTMEVRNYTAAANTHFPVFQTSSPNTYSGSRHCTIDTSANLTCTGVVSGVVGQADGKQTAIYAMQSAENWLEDAGSNQLSGGSVRIEIDSAFAQTVNAGVEYHVFLTPNGDSKGLYVSQKTATSFEVHEQGGGTSSIAFDYRIMAKRKGYENVRLEDVTERFKQHAAPVQKTRRPLPSIATGPAARPPAPQLSPFVAPRPTEPITPKIAPLPHPAAQAGKPEVNHK